MAPNNRSRSNSTAHQQQALRTNSPNVNRTNFRNQQHQNQNQQQQQQQQYVHHQPTRPPTSMTPSGTPQRAIQAVQQMADMGMSPGSRYSQNLKVLRRHDPSIVSIFYQFSHVVVYRYDEQKWVRGGCEGTMFLFEREQAPKYGFFILNRVGPNDFIQIINDADELGSDAGLFKYYVYGPRYKPKAPIRKLGNSNTDSSSSSDEMSLPTPDAPKGQPKQTIGLWIHGEEAYEALSSVMTRVLMCVREGQAYPDEYRLDLGRRLPDVGLSPIPRRDSEEDVFGTRPTSRPSGTMVNSPSPNATRRTRPSNLSNGNIQAQLQPNVSELDKLFAKLGDTDVTRATPPVQSPPAQVPAATHTSAPAPAPQVTTANTLLEMLKSSSVRQPTVSSSKSFPQAVTSSQSPPTSGKALLDSIFASVNPSASVPSLNTSTFPRQQQIHQHSTVAAPPPDGVLQHLQITRTVNGDAPIKENVIYSPKPSSAVLPQILTADVIHELMGMTSRSESSTSSSYSPSSAGAGIRKASKDKDRGYIADRGEDDGLSESSTGFDASIDADSDERLKNSRMGTTSISRSTFLSVGGSAQGSTSGSNVVGGSNSNSSGGNIKGDATPRARSDQGLEPVRVHHGQDGLREIVAAMSAPAAASSRVRSPVTKSAAGAGTATTIATTRRGAERTVSESTVTLTNATTTINTTTIARGAAFQAGSELWPHERTSTHGSSDSASVPSLNGHQATSTDKSAEEEVVELDFSEISVLEDMKAFEAKEVPMSRRAKAKARSQAQAQQAQVQPQSQIQPQSQQQQAQSHVVSPPGGKHESKSKRGKKETQVAQVNGAVVHEAIANAGRVPNGKSSQQQQRQAPLSPPPQSQPQSQPVSPPRPQQQSFPEIAQNVLVKSALDSGIKGVPVLPKNDFVRELLELIHTDRGFVEKLYENYLSSAKST